MKQITSSIQCVAYLLLPMIVSGLINHERIHEKIIVPHVEDIQEHLVQGSYTGIAKIQMIRDSTEGMHLAASELSKLMQCDKPKRVFRNAGIHEKKHIEANLDLWYEANCDIEPFQKDVSPREREVRASQSIYHALSRLNDHLIKPENEYVASTFQSVSPGLRTKLFYTTDDPDLSDQDGHYGAINLYDAWDMTAGDKNVVVQVIDTGLDMYHPEFENGNIWVNSGEICGNGVDDDNNGFIDDCYGYNHGDDDGTNLLGDGSHGTHCSGTIAADNDNAEYVAGVAGGKNGADGASLMTSVLFGQTSISSGAEELIYGADNGAHISSNSWGYTAANYYDQSVLDAIDYAVDAGVIVVFAAGNDNSDSNFYPGCYDSVIGVAALNNDGTRASFSNYGDWIDISAPGVNILSTVTMSDGYTAYYSGTSMATPHVAGMLALGLALDSNGDKSIDCMYTSATDVDGLNSGYENMLGAGMINAISYLTCLGAPTNTPTLSVAPSTAMPSPKPTTQPPSVSPVPTDDCMCNSYASLRIVTDNYPSETKWYLNNDVNEVNECSDYSVEGGPYDSSNTEYIEEIPDMCVGYTYTFRITDSYGDGICCAWGQGSYELTNIGEVVASGSDFSYSESTSFVAASVPIASPTNSPTSSSPTKSPTLCNVPYSVWVGDGFCDYGDYNTVECNWDGGDCCTETCVTGIKSSCGINGYECLDPMTSSPTSYPSPAPTLHPSSLPIPMPTSVPTTPAPSSLPIPVPTSVPTTPAPSSLPIPKPTSNPTIPAPSTRPIHMPTSGVCEDDSDWTWTKSNGAVKNCRWVSKNTRNRCRKNGDDGRDGYTGCMDTCGTC